MSSKGWYEMAAEDYDNKFLQSVSNNLYYVIMTPNDQRHDAIKYASIEAAQKSCERHPFTWQDWEKKGYKIVKIDVEQLKHQQNILTELLK